MKRKIKKLIAVAVVLGGVSLLICGGVLGLLAAGALPGVWSWTKSTAMSLASLHPEAAEIAQSFAAWQIIDPELRGALNAMGQVTLEPQALLGQLAAAAVPTTALDGLSPAEMNAKLAQWGVPLRVVEPPTTEPPGAATTAAPSADAGPEWLNEPWVPTRESRLTRP